MVKEEYESCCWVRKWAACQGGHTPIFMSLLSQYQPLLPCGSTWETTDEQSTFYSLPCSEMEIN